jgi:NAD-dependent DNA ligase
VKCLQFLYRERESLNLGIKHKSKLVKTVLKISLIIFCFIALTNCNQEENDILVSEVNATMKNSEDYEVDLLISGDEEGATIKTQAQHFQKSELVRDSSTNWSVVYKYEPLPQFTGTDFVEIETCTGGDATGCANIKIIRINFTVTN